MTPQNTPQDRVKVLVRVLRAQQRLLSEAGAPKSLLSDFAIAIRYIGSMDPTALNEAKDRRNFASNIDARFKDILDNTKHLGLDVVDKIIRDEDVPRRILELVAIQRFDVPKGSMRSFSSIDSLRSKLESLVQNERIHQAISSVAHRKTS